MKDETGINRRFSQSANTYDNYAKVQIKVAETLINQLTSKSPKHIFEIGCGTGLLTTLLIDKYPHAQLTITDLSPTMLATTKQKLLEAYPEKQDQFNFKTLNAEANIGSETYDLIISSMAIHWFNNIKQTIDNFKDCLNPDASFYYSTIGTDCFYEWRQTLNDLNFPIGLRIPEGLPGIIKKETIKVPYGTARVFLKSLKNTGAHSPKPGYTPLSSPELKIAMSALEKNYDANISWQIIYGKVNTTK